MKKSPLPATEPTSGFQYISDPAIKSLWADTFSMAFRDDGIVMIRAFSILQEGSVEQTRIVTNKGNIEAFIDSMCKIMKYTPKDPEQKK